MDKTLINRVISVIVSTLLFTSVTVTISDIMRCMALYR